MVTAGIFMVARMSPLFELSPTALSFVLVIGAITCFFMALIATVQYDIKRVVAYSTLSQLGYMTMALGASAYSVAIFHLMTHAFFKAVLFLGAGSVIIAMHHEQDMRRMGGLRKYMPITYDSVDRRARECRFPFAGFLFEGFDRRGGARAYAAGMPVAGLPTLRHSLRCSSAASTRSGWYFSRFTARRRSTRMRRPTRPRTTNRLVMGTRTMPTETAECRMNRRGSSRCR